MALKQISIMARGEPMQEQVYPGRQQPVEIPCWSRGKVWEATEQPRVEREIRTEGMELTQERDKERCCLKVFFYFSCPNLLQLPRN